MVRQINVTDVPVSAWSAIAALMREQIERGTFEDTVVTVEWSEDQPSLGMGMNEDADQVDVEQVRDEGLRCARNYHACGGGSGIFTPELPLVLFYYKHDPHDKETNSLLKHFDDLNGAANAAALQKVGLNGQYRSIGDAEVVVDDNSYKVMASAATSFPQSEYWAAVSSIIWEAPSRAEMMDKAIDMPKEKFEDKDTDSLTSRMRPISVLLDDLNKDVTKQEVVDAVVEENVAKIFGEDEDIVEEEWDDEEREYIEDMVPYFESDTWINRVSTEKFCRTVPDHLELGIAAFKSRKLIKASVLFDGDEIYDVMFSGDFYFRPAADATTNSLLDKMGAALSGIDPTNKEALEAELVKFFEQDANEFPALEPSDFVQPVIRANQNREPVTEYQP